MFHGRVYKPNFVMEIIISPRHNVITVVPEQSKWREK
jgi:hypothetical protein